MGAINSIENRIWATDHCPSGTSKSSSSWWGGPRCSANSPWTIQKVQDAQSGVINILTDQPARRECTQPYAHPQCWGLYDAGNNFAHCVEDRGWTEGWSNGMDGSKVCAYSQANNQRCDWACPGSHTNQVVEKEHISAMGGTTIASACVFTVLAGGGLFKIGRKRRLENEREKSLGGELMLTEPGPGVNAAV